MKKFYNRTLSMLLTLALVLGMGLNQMAALADDEAPIEPSDSIIVSDPEEMPGLVLRAHMH